ncbi:tRNA wybutosine-synthesizing protein 2 [Methanolinea mesophila]|uniref:class I SAM-dependent methyltransferase n=1 Tax=Methanolinea mesophila TaxID=547055 RepID=UPI001AE718D9|nr:SAM-dependent methyltransferase [Methanolinea mesophila]MBP1928059.1 tRNA wybutosine-synthesizing protein 2 [Methanolinea mesophila]
MRVREVGVKELGKIRGAVWRDEERRVWVEGNTAYVPVREGYSFTRDLSPRTPYSGRGYYLMGNVAVLHGKDPSEKEIREIVEWTGAEGVLLVHSCDGCERIPRAEVVYGTVGEVCHHEAGIRYHLDPRHLMFSMGNREEKARLCANLRQGERVADMFAGIGYFTLPIARRGAKVHAMEINPLAYRYLVRNVGENAVTGRVKPEQGDCRDLLRGTYDRILMGHFESVQFLDSALHHAGPGTVLHVHSAGSTPPDLGEALIQAGFTGTITPRKVKKYAPHRWHYVQDVILA